MQDLESWLDRVYQAGGDRATLDRLYDEWAADYDQQIWGSGNPFIAVAAAMAGRHIADFDAAILDAGCGTGNMAQVLYRSAIGTWMASILPLACSSSLGARASTKRCIGSRSTRRLICRTGVTMPCSLQAC